MMCSLNIKFASIGVKLKYRGKDFFVLHLWVVKMQTFKIRDPRVNRGRFGWWRQRSSTYDHLLLLFSWHFPPQTNPREIVKHISPESTADQEYSWAAETAHNVKILQWYTYTLATRAPYTVCESETCLPPGIVTMAGGGRQLTFECTFSSGTVISECSYKNCVCHVFLGRHYWLVF